MPVERPWGELLVHADADLLPIVAVCSNIDSLHRMTREERDLHGAHRQRQRPPHRLQPLRRGGESARLHGRGVRAAAAPLRGRAGGVGRAPRSAGQGDRGHRARPGLGLPLARAAAAQAAALRLEGHPHALGRSDRPGHAVRSGDRRAHRRRPGGAGLQDLGGRQLGRRRRGRSASSPTGSASPGPPSRAPRFLRSGPKYAVARPAQGGPRRVPASTSGSHSSGAGPTSVSSWTPRSRPLGERFPSRSGPRPGTSWPTPSWRARPSTRPGPGPPGRRGARRALAPLRRNAGGRFPRGLRARLREQLRRSPAGRTSSAPGSPSTRRSWWTSRPGSAWRPCPGWSA